MLAAAEGFRDRLPDTLRALSEGRIDEAKAHTILAATTSTSHAVAAQVEQCVLPDAATVTATTLRRRCERAVIALDPDGAHQRHRRRLKERYVSRWPAADGMAGLSVYSSAQDIATIHETLTALADAAKTPGDGRDLGNRRVDVLVGLCTDALSGPARADGSAPVGALGLGDSDQADAPGAGPLTRHRRARVRPQIRITMPLTALLGSDEPCDLDGHGSITAQQARIIAADGVLTRLVCDPLSGTLLDYGRTRYEPPEALKTHVRARDGECVMPICSQPATRADIDHVIPARPTPTPAALPTDPRRPSHPTGARRPSRTPTRRPIELRQVRCRAAIDGRRRHEGPQTNRSNASLLSGSPAPGVTSRPIQACIDPSIHRA